jgi:hypothetical protein
MVVPAESLGCAPGFIDSGVHHVQVMVVFIYFRYVVCHAIGLGQFSIPGDLQPSTAGSDR